MPFNQFQKKSELFSNRWKNRFAAAFLFDLTRCVMTNLANFYTVLVLLFLKNPLHAKAASIAERFLKISSDLVGPQLLPSKNHKKVELRHGQRPFVF